MKLSTPPPYPPPQSGGGDTSNNIVVEIQFAVEPSPRLPSETDFHQWVELALLPEHSEAELCIRIVTEAESQALNLQYRHKDKPTNVLSFSAELPPGIPSPLLGDLVICQAVVEKEALEQSKDLMAHWAHMVVHGTLHLLGYDHEKADEARDMEAIEVKLLTSFGYSNPYEDPA